MPKGHYVRKRSGLRSGVFTGAMLAREQRDWLDFRAREDGLSVSQVLRKVVVRAAQEGWSFGGAVSPDAARKAGI